MLWLQERRWQRPGGAPTSPAGRPLRQAGPPLLCPRWEGPWAAPALRPCSGAQRAPRGARTWSPGLGEAQHPQRPGPGLTAALTLVRDRGRGGRPGADSPGGAGSGTAALPREVEEGAAGGAREQPCAVRGAAECGDGPRELRWGRVCRRCPWGGGEGRG